MRVTVKGVKFEAVTQSDALCCLVAWTSESWSQFQDATYST